MQTVFHHARADQADAVLANVENLLQDDTVDIDAVSVVANADAVQTFTRDSEVADQIRDLAEERDVEFLACANSLDSREMDADDLLDVVDTVPAGVGALTRLQHEGYTYVKD